MHRSGIYSYIVEDVSSARMYYYVKESDLCQGDFNIIIIVVGIH